MNIFCKSKYWSIENFNQNLKKTQYVGLSIGVFNTRIIISVRNKFVSDKWVENKLKS